jgi:hypothetical protein
VAAVKIRAMAVAVVAEDGSRWAVTLVPKVGRDGIEISAVPGYTDPLPVELVSGIEVIPPSTLDGTWALAASGVGSVEMRRVTDE